MTVVWLVITTLPSALAALTLIAGTSTAKCHLSISDCHHTIFCFFAAVVGLVNTIMWYRHT